jgi:hypothetical protein
LFLNRLGTASCIRRSREGPQATDHPWDASKVRALEGRTQRGRGGVSPAFHCVSHGFGKGQRARRLGDEPISADGSKGVHSKCAAHFVRFGKTSVRSKRSYFARCHACISQHCELARRNCNRCEVVIIHRKTTQSANTGVPSLGRVFVSVRFPISFNLSVPVRKCVGLPSLLASEEWGAIRFYSLLCLRSLPEGFSLKPAPPSE